MEPWIQWAYEDGRRDGMLIGVLSVVVVLCAWHCWYMWKNRRKEK